MNSTPRKIFYFITLENGHRVLAEEAAYYADTWQHYHHDCIARTWTSKGEPVYVCTDLRDPRAVPFYLICRKQVEMPSFTTFLNSYWDPADDCYEDWIIPVADGPP